METDFANDDGSIHFYYYYYYNGSPVLGWYIDRRDRLYLAYNGFSPDKEAERVVSQSKSYPVASISPHAFAESIKLQSIEIPGCVKKIGACAFENCHELRQVNLQSPSTLTNISSYAFSGCGNIARITLPENLEEIGEGAFRGCEKLEHIEFRCKDVRIGKDAFRGCKALKEIDLKCVAEIGEGAFSGCVGLKKLVLPASTDVLGDAAFESCSNLNAIVIEHRPSYSKGLTNLFGMAESYAVAPKVIETGFFPVGLDTSNVVELKITEGTREGGARLCLPPNVEKVSVPATIECMTNGLIRGGVKYTVDPHNAVYASDGEHTLFTKDKTKLLAYSNRSAWYTVGFDGWFGASLPPCEIADGAFQHCDRLHWVYFPEGVQKIGANAFRGDKSLMGITFGGPLTNINVLVNGGPITTIGECAFADCPELSNVGPFPYTLKNLGDKAFNNSPNITSINFFGENPTVKNIYPAEDVFSKTSAGCDVLGWYIRDYTNKWAKVIEGKKIEGLWQGADMHIMSTADIQNSFANVAAYKNIHDDVLVTLIDENGDEFAYTNEFSIVNGQPIGPLPAPKRRQCVFEGWFDDPNGGARIGDDYIVNGNITLHARWRNYWIVSFDLNCDDAAMDVEIQALCVEDGGMAGRLPDPIRSGYTFYGWTTEDGVEYDGSAVVNEDLTLCAHWKKVIGDGNIVFTVIDDDLEAVEFLSPTTEIVFPDGIKRIGLDAFRDCAFVKKITIPNGVETIGAYSFFECVELEEVVCPETLKSIATRAFYGCGSLKTINLPLSLEEIGSEAFYGCATLTDISIPNGISEIGSMVFYGCAGIKSIVIPDNVCRVGSAAFGNCTGLTNLVIPDSITSVGWGAFSGCSKLEEVTIPPCITNLQDAFGSAYKTIRKVVLSSGFRSIPSKMFYKCGIEEVIIPDSVVEIGNLAFAGCGIKKARIPGCVTNIGYTLGSSLTITNVVLSPTISEIPDKMFYLCHNLVKVSIPSVVTNIGDSAFYYCEKLERISLPYNLENIGNMAFCGCSGLKSLTVPNNVTVIGASAFSGCTAIESLTLPDSLRAIGDNAFYGANGLTCVHIPDSVTNIGSCVFAMCSNLMQISVDKGNPVYGSVNNLLLTKDGKCLVQGVNGNVIIPESVSAISNYAFYACGGLKSVIIPKSVIGVRNNAFSYCSGLTDVVFLSNAPTIEPNAFKGINSLCCAWAKQNATGFDVDSEGKWQGMKFAIIPEAAFPDISNDLQVVVGLAEATDRISLIIDNITTKTQYDAFREWAESVKDVDGETTAGRQAVKDSNSAWLSFALGADALIEKEIATDDVKIESFTPALTDGKFDFTVSVKDVNIGGGSVAKETLKENLKKVLGVEGAATLTPDAFTSDNIDITFGAPVNGKAKISVSPPADAGNSFFMRVKVK